MEQITTRIAKESEIDWVNSMYAEVDFVKSTSDNELIVIAEINTTKCGIGRLVKINNDHLELGGIYVFANHRGKGVAQSIVKFLCNKNTFEQQYIWCLPFENLKKFYEKFGFNEHLDLIDKKIPQQIIKKHTWCTTNYEKAVLLLSKNN